MSGEIKMALLEREAENTEFERKTRKELKEEFDAEMSAEAERQRSEMKVIIICILNLQNRIQKFCGDSQFKELMTEIFDNQKQQNNGKE